MPTRPSRMLLSIPVRRFKQFLNMSRANTQATLQKMYDNPEVVVHEPAFKPSYTLEFDRAGELLLYSCDPLRHKTIYFKYPYILYETSAFFMFWAFLVNPWAIHWGYNSLLLLGTIMAFFPRAWFMHSMQYRIRNIYLLRGGKFVKFERNTMMGDQLTNWGEVREFRPLTEDFREFAEKETTEFLNDEGQLKYELAVQCDNFRQWSITDQDVPVFFMKEGVVHHPEVFDAVMRGYQIDTSDFVINTANEVRVREPRYGM